MGKDKQIWLDQSLHGYSDGHRLLASSRNFSKAAQRTMLVLSDMSGPSVVPGFNSYLTGYPLRTEDVYAFAKTWYAPEMERPGCVWTHTLLIKNKDFRKIPELAVIRKLFHRPSERLQKYLYEDPIPVDSSYDTPEESVDSFCNGLTLSDGAAFWVHIARNIMFYLYGYQDNPPILLAATKSDRYEKIILKFWSQQWPDLRKVFTFCTGSLSNRSLGDKDFDLQAIPTGAARQFERDVPHAHIVKSKDTQLELSHHEWVFIAVEDLLEEKSGKLRKYLWEVGGNSDVNRSAYLPLVKIYDCLRTTKINRRTIEGLLRELVKFYPKPKQGNGLKKRLFGPLRKNQRSLLTGIDEPDLLRSLALTKYHSLLSAEMLGIPSRVRLLWSEKKSMFMEIIIDLIRTDINPIGEEILMSVVEIIQIDELLELSNRERELLFVFVERRPELASCERLWAGTVDYQRELLDHLARGSPSEKNIKSIVNAMLDAHTNDIAEDAYNHFRKTVINALLEWFDKRALTKEARLYPAWKKVLRIAPEDSLTWLSNAVKPKAETVALIASQLDPHSEITKKYGTQMWREFLDSIRSDLNYKTHMTLAEFLLPFSLNKPGPHYDKLAEFSFKIIHDALARDELSYDSWRRLEPVLPRLPWYRAWDKCERLRRGLERIGLSVKDG